MKNKKLFINLCLIFCAILGFGIIIHHMIRFIYADFFIENPNVTTFVGENVVNPWIDLTFFTYITVIIFSLWCLLYALSNIFSFKKLNNFLRKNTVICFVFCNYLLTFALYTIFQLVDEPTFGWFGDLPLSWHSLYCSIILHYVFFIIECVLFAKIKTTQSNHKNGHIYSTLFLFAYYTIVKLLGEFAYQIRYFPYIIFDAKSFGEIFGVSNYLECIILLVACCAILFVLYQLVFYILLKIKTKQQEKSETIS